MKELFDTEIRLIPRHELYSAGKVPLNELLNTLHITIAVTH
jgi:hypothetical protein